MKMKRFKLFISAMLVIFLSTMTASAESASKAEYPVHAHWWWLIFGILVVFVLVVAIISLNDWIENCFRSSLIRR